MIQWMSRVTVFARIRSVWVPDYVVWNGKVDDRKEWIHGQFIEARNSHCLPSPRAVTMGTSCRSSAECRVLRV